jgi:hypothetical protein
MGKRGLKLVFFMFIFVVLVVGVSAQDDGDDLDIDDIDIGVGGEDLVDKAYTCLNSQIADKSLSLQESVFSTLALGSKPRMADVINSEKKSDEACWPKADCRLRETAQVLLAKERVGENTEGIEAWLLSKTEDVGRLIWFLQITVEGNQPTSCTVTYDGRVYDIDVLEDQTVTGNTGTCLDITNEGYWLRIRGTCLENAYEVTCDQDFSTSLLYQRETGVVFVSSEIQGAASLGTTTERVEAKCFTSDGVCGYEGSLWAALALQKTGNDITPYLPYILSFAETNSRFFPSTFIYSIIGGDTYYSEIVEKQTQGDYWQVIGSPSRFYDTSLALLALSGTGAVESENAKEYLLSIQTEEGCWNNNNIRDTAFLLYGGWSKSVSRVNVEEDCEDAGYYCEENSECLDEEGEVFDDYDCMDEGFGLYCCSVDVPEKSCSEKEGAICASNEQCTGNEVSSLEGTCCLGSCEEVEENICELTGGECRFLCDVDEDESDESCGAEADKVCCFEAPPRGFGFGWIIILVIVVALIVVGVLYRNKIKLWYYARRAKKAARPKGPPRPPGAYPTVARPAAPRRVAPRPAVPPKPRAISAEEKKLQETLKKLKGK